MNDHQDYGADHDCDDHDDHADVGTDAVTSMKGMFCRASSFSQPIGDWSTEAVTDMAGMFHMASSMSDCSKAHIGRSAGFVPLSDKAAWGNIAICGA